MDHPHPHARVALVRLGRHAEDLGDLRADVGGLFAALVGVDHGRDLLDQALVPGLDGHPGHLGVAEREAVGSVADDHDPGALVAQGRDGDLDRQLRRAGLEGEDALEGPAVRQVGPPADQGLGAGARGRGGTQQHDGLGVRVQDRALAHGEDRLGHRRQEAFGVEGSHGQPDDLVHAAPSTRSGPDLSGCAAVHLRWRLRLVQDAGHAEHARSSPRPTTSCSCSTTRRSASSRSSAAGS